MFSKLVKTFRAFSRAERMVFSVSFLVFVFASFFLVGDYLNRNTTRVPVNGGEYREGVLGQPTFVNPVLVGANDVDRDLSEILFANILDLADNYKVSPDGKVWTIRLKDNVVWDDKEPITSDDVLFTIDTIQNPDSRSLLFPLWQGIVAQRVSEREFKLVLAAPYAFLESNLKELRPIPKHIFGALPAGNLRLSNFNLEPIGSGPFRYSSFEKRRDGFITHYYLVPNDRYFGKKPYLGQLIFKFYDDEKSLIDAFNNGAIDGMGGLSTASLGKINIGHEVISAGMPKYYAVFLNQYASPTLKEKNIRLALNYAVDKKEIVGKIFDNFALPAEGPMMPGMEGFAPKVYPVDEFSLEKANQILDASGWKIGDDGLRTKITSMPVKERGRTVQKDTPVPLEFRLVVPDTPFLVQAANILKDQWLKAGIKLNLEVVSPQGVQNDFIKTRNYEMLLFGNIFGANPDLFSFWHSSEEFYPGLNLALYDNRIVDGLIEAVRKDLDKNNRQVDFASLQSAIIEDAPAVFLFSPSYLYVTKSWLRGLELKFVPLSSDRFADVEQWYVKTALVFK